MRPAQAMIAEGIKKAGSQNKLARETDTAASIICNYKKRGTFGYEFAVRLGRYLGKDPGKMLVEIAVDKHERRIERQLDRGSASPTLLAAIVAAGLCILC